MRFAYRVVDVFTDRPLAGNALAVVLDPVPEAAKQAIARELNLSETSFPVVVADGEYEVSIHTPVAELPFAGHPTLGTAWVLGPGRWTQRSPGAVVEVEADEGGAWMSFPEPTFTEVDPAPFADALGLPAEAAVEAAAGGTRHLLVATDVPLERARVDLGAVAELSRRHVTTSVAPVRRLDDRTLEARVFCPAAGIVEDPGTGSAAGPFARWCRSRWALDAVLTIRQGDHVGRPCRIEVEDGPAGLRVGGRVAAVAEGVLTL